MSNYVSGHLWNDWMFVANSLAKLLKHQRLGNERKNVIEFELYSLVTNNHGIVSYRYAGKELTSEEKAKLNEYHQYVFRMNEEINKLRLLSSNIRAKGENTTQGYLWRLLVFESQCKEEISQILLKMRRIAIEVNEFLYARTCIFFDEK